MLALALSSKLHILAIIPLLYLYIYKKDGFIEATKSIGVSFLLTVLIILPFFDIENNFMKMVIMNKEHIVSLADATDKELREAHNLEKIYKSNGFSIA